MSNVVAKYFGYLAASYPSKEELAACQSDIVGIITVDPEDIFDFSSSMIHDMADVIVNDIIGMNDEQAIIFREEFFPIMDHIAARFEFVINSKIISHEMDFSEGSFCWETIAEELNMAIQKQSGRIAHMAVMMSRMPSGEGIYCHEDFMSKEMMAEAKMREEFFQAIRPCLEIKDTQVLSFMLERTLVEDMIDDIEDVMVEYSAKEISTISKVSRDWVQWAQSEFAKEYKSYESGLKSSGFKGAPFALVGHWGKCARNTMDYVCTKIVESVMGLEDQEIDPNAVQIKPHL